MKALLSFVFLIVGLITVNAQQYKPVDEKSDITFTIKNFGLNTNGSIKGLKGTIKFSPSNPATSSFDVSVDVNTINTGIDSRDNHLKKEEYFNAEKFPTINFTSTNITANQSGYTITGRLTIKGLTKTISFPFNIKNESDGIVFTGNFSISRKDFNVGGGSAVLSNNVNVSLKVFAAKG